MMMHAAYSPGGHRRSAVAVRPAVATAIAGSAMAIGACGSSGGGPAAVGATTEAPNASPLGLPQCMRANGISHFPDLSTGPGGQGLGISAMPDKATLTVVAPTRASAYSNSPAFNHAVTVCRAGLRKP